MLKYIKTGDIMKNKKSLFGSSILLIAAIIWGSTFVAQSKGMNFLGPFSFNGIRCIIAVIFLSLVLLVVILANRKNKDFKLYNNKKAIIWSIFCGIALMFSTSTQQIGISMTSVGKSGFITSLYIILVPIVGLFIKKKVPIKIWFCVLVVLVGLYLLCFKGSLKIETGDIFLLLSALGFAVQILIVDTISDDINPIFLSIIQIGVVAILSLIPIFSYEKPTFENTINAMPYLLYAALLSSGIAYTFQIIGQKYTNHVVSSLIMSLESVFAALTGWLVLNEQLSTNETIGCILIFIAIIIAQIEFKRKRPVNE